MNDDYLSEGFNLEKKQNKNITMKNGDDLNVVT